VRRPHRSRGTTIAVALLAATLAIGAVGCGGGDDDEGADLPAPTAVTSMEPPPATEDGAPTVLDIPAAAEGLAFEVTEATAPAGEVTLSMPNPSPVPHNIAVEEPELVEGEVVQQDGVSEITVDFPAGEYEYYCSVPGHRQAGMVGTLTVE